MEVEVLALMQLNDLVKGFTESPEFLPAALGLFSFERKSTAVN